MSGTGSQQTAQRSNWLENTYAQAGVTGTMADAPAVYDSESVRDVLRLRGGADPEADTISRQLEAEYNADVRSSPYIDYSIGLVGVPLDAPSAATPESSEVGRYFGLAAGGVYGAGKTFFVDPLVGGVQALGTVVGSGLDRIFDPLGITYFNRHTENLGAALYNAEQFFRQNHPLDSVFSSIEGRLDQANALRHSDPLLAGSIYGGLGAEGLGLTAGGAGVIGATARRLERLAGIDEVVGGGTTHFGRFASADEFGAEAFTRYQRYTDQEYAAALAAEARGRLVIPEGMSRETILGQRADAFARSRMERWLESEHISEGPGQAVQLNRWLRDPSGSGAYRIPDVRVPGANLILDGTIGMKWQTTPQVADFYKFSGGSRVIIVRPTELGGSYSLLPPR